MLAAHEHLKTEAPPAPGAMATGRNGSILTGIGPVSVRRPKVRDRGIASVSRRAILPRFARRTRSLDAVLPTLYLRGVSSGDFQEALDSVARQGRLWLVGAGDRPPEGQCPSTRWRRATCRPDATSCGPMASSPGSAEKQCILVLIGATPEGRTGTRGLPGGGRESAQSWRELLACPRGQGSRSSRAVVGEALWIPALATAASRHPPRAGSTRQRMSKRRSRDKRPSALQISIGGRPRTTESPLAKSATSSPDEGGLTVSPPRLALRHAVFLRCPPRAPTVRPWTDERAWKCLSRQPSRDGRSLVVLASQHPPPRNVAGKVRDGMSTKPKPRDRVITASDTLELRPRILKEDQIRTVPICAHPKRRPTDNSRARSPPPGSEEPRVPVLPAGSRASRSCFTDCSPDRQDGAADKMSSCRTAVTSIAFVSPSRSGARCRPFGTPPTSVDDRGGADPTRAAPADRSWKRRRPVSPAVWQVLGTISRPPTKSGRVDAARAAGAVGRARGAPTFPGRYAAHVRGTGASASEAPWPRFGGCARA